MAADEQRTGPDETGDERIEEEPKAEAPSPELPAAETGSSPDGEPEEAPEDGPEDLTIRPEDDPVTALTKAMHAAGPVDAEHVVHRSPEEVAHLGEDLPPERVIVEFRDVSKTFGEGEAALTAVDDVNFRVVDIPGEGEFIGVLGPSGCGKSTILNMIAGFYGPTTGEVLKHGESVTGPGADRGMVFQSYSSYPQLTVLENVAFGLFIAEENRPKNPFLALLDAFLGVRGRRRRAIHDYAMHWVERVGLAGHEEKFPHQLSGGMRQRVALARTLALRPEIILMDEPFGALDRVTRWEMQDLLVDLWRDEEATVFLVTHDIGEAVYLGDRTYILTPAPGRIEEEVDVPPPDRPAAEMQRDPTFHEIVREISEKVERRLEEA